MRKHFKFLEKLKNCCIHKNKVNKSRLINIIHRWYGQARDFSPMIALSDIICSTVLRKSNGELKHKLNIYYYDKAKNIIKQRYYDIIKNWNFPVNINDLPCFNKQLPIYIFWWQSLDNAPGLIKETIKIIQEKSENPVVILDRNNFSSFINLPDYVVRNVQNEDLSITAFSDILRYNLLAKTGGMWIDPTCYLSKSFSDEIYQYPFYTINHQDAWEHPICKGKWSTFFLCSGENNPLFGYLRDMINSYWEHEKNLAVYLLPDVFFAIGYENIQYIREIIDMVPPNNTERTKLLKSLRENNGKYFEQLLAKIDKKTYIHKLTYKTYIDKFYNVK